MRVPLVPGGGRFAGGKFWLWSGEGSLDFFRQCRAGSKNCRESAGPNGVLQTDLPALAVMRQHNAGLAKLVS